MPQASGRNFLRSPLRNLLSGTLFVLTVSQLAILSYVLVGWSLGDAVYMTVLTIFTVGYTEVRPIDTGVLRGITITLIVCGCTGMIFVTGALVQLITAAQIQTALGVRRMRTDIDRLKRHVIVCGFGRIGRILARDLAAGGTPFVVIERDEARAERAQDAGCLVIVADAETEDTLRQAGVERAHALATVLPNDAANVFITLTARAMNRKMTIIARGEAPSTEGKLRLAGANEVVLPAHIGAERMAELLLFPGRLSHERDSARMQGWEAELRRLGLSREVVVAEAGGLAAMTVGEIERRAGQGVFVVAIERPDGADIERPGPELRVEPGDGLVVIGRLGQAEMLRALRPA